MCASREFFFSFFTQYTQCECDYRQNDNDTKKTMNSFMKFEKFYFYTVEKLVFVNAFNKRSTCHSLYFVCRCRRFLNFVFCIQRSFCLKYERLLIFCLPQVVSKSKLLVQRIVLFFLSCVRFIFSFKI